MNKACRRLASIALAFACCTATVAAQETWRFRWTKGTALDYRVEHTTSVSEVVDGAKVESASKLQLVKRWQVQEVDDKGNALLALTLTAMRHEQTRPNGEVLLFDSAQPDKSTPGLRDQMMQYVGKTLAVLRMDPQGRILEVQKGQASRYEAEPPFVLVFPASAPQEGQSWVRPYQLTLDPPLGTGEKFKAGQKIRCAKLEGGRAIFEVANEIEGLPAAASEQVPLLQKMAQGQAIFDVAAGRLVSARLTIDRTLKDHQGQGSSYRFRSDYTETLLSPGAPAGN